MLWLVWWKFNLFWWWNDEMRILSQEPGWRVSSPRFASLRFAREIENWFPNVSMPRGGGAHPVLAGKLQEATCTEVSTGTHNICLESKIQHKIEFSVQWMFILFTRVFLVARSLWWLCQLLRRQVRWTWSIMFSMGCCVWLRSKVEVVDGHCAQVRVPGRSVLLSVSWMLWTFGATSLMLVFQVLWSLDQFSHIFFYIKSIHPGFLFGALWWLTILGIFPISRTFSRTLNHQP